MNKTPTVAILSPGAMGSAVAQRLAAHGVEVLTDLAGRSDATRSRALDAGMQPASIERIAEADLILAIVPPGEARALAAQMAAALARSPSPATYVECNAVNPDSVIEIATLIGEAGAPFVDASIIGLPPREGYDGPTFFASGEAAHRFEVLASFGLKVHRLDAPVGAASALKMCYGGITKGMIAIGASMMLGAMRSGSGQALFEEMSRTQAALLGGFSKSVPDMFGKASRWVSEMEEIAAFLGAGRAESDVFRAFARLYERLGADQAADRAEISLLQDFLKGGVRS
jgi:3-hydroxyisobutyrate dehydrogenase-like beta-hydroxyacid dehydrogenase